jgi:hypothetical protein
MQVLDIVGVTASTETGRVVCLQSNLTAGSSTVVLSLQDLRLLLKWAEAKEEAHVKAITQCHY